MKSISGIWTALLTPFDENGKIDKRAWQALLENQVKAGVQGIIPCGTTGESPTLSQEEKKDLIRSALEITQGTGVGVIAGTGSYSTQSTIEFSKWASDEGVQGVLVVTPYYNKPSQTGLERHFTEVANQIECDLVLYNVPGRTGTSLSAETIATLSQHPKITALKEATGNLSFASEILEALKKQKSALSLLSGDDATFFPFLCIGGSGVISVASNLIPKEMVELDQAFKKGNWDKAKEIHQRYFSLFKNLMVESNPVPVKYAFSKLGFGSSQVRLPLVELSSTSRTLVDQTLKQCGL